MTPTRAVILCSFVLLAAPAASSAETVPDSLERRHIRITEPWLRQIFAVGLESSPTFKALVDRIGESDVVVYLQTDPFGIPGVAGRLTFLSVVADIRYVVIRLTPLRSAVQQLAMIGHELQHAVEVAERPSIVDAESMYREYLRIGYLNGSTGSGVAVDTRAAIEAGGRISAELRQSPVVIPPALLP